jgi:predicted nucleic-acid-binding protein
MIGLDTNVLVRYLVQDDRVQARQASKAIAGAAAGGERLFVGVIVLCELVWVLETAYGYARTEIQDTLERMLLTDQFEIEDSDQVWLALGDYRSSGADFADALIGRHNVAVGCGQTLTFDRSLRALEAFRVLA